MLAFIDESGDPGLKIRRGSSRYFTMCMVYFKDEVEAVNCSNFIEQLKTDMGIKNRKREFKFTSLKKEQRLHFLKEMLPFSFLYIGLIIDKEKFLKQDLVATEKTFYKYAASLLFELAKPVLYKALVEIDGEKSRSFKNELSKIFRSKDKKLVRKLKLQESHKSNLLQLADMIVGSLSKTLTDESDSQIYHKTIKFKKIGLRIFPPGNLSEN
jgi:Protein of unknown function (DUF3800)